MCDEYDAKVSEKAFIQIKILILIYLFKGHLTQKRKEEEVERRGGGGEEGREGRKARRRWRKRGRRQGEGWFTKKE